MLSFVAVATTDEVISRLNRICSLSIFYFVVYVYYVSGRLLSRAVSFAAVFADE